jgi:YbbR domain-containing protein
VNTKSATSKGAAAGWLSDALMRDWSTKMVALGLALVVFVVTRDEVTRSFRVPLEVRTDPERVLRTSLPEEVAVELRGPWTKMAGVRVTQLGSATLDLRAAEPGPLRLDPASIVMPEGVVLSELLYEAVDLRFEDVITRELSVIPQLSGEVHPDYERVGVVVDPPSWAVRGARSEVERLPSLQTEVLTVDGATGAVDRRLALMPPASGVNFDGEKEPAVRVKLNVRARRGDREFKVDLEPTIAHALEAKAPEFFAVEPATTERVVVRGALPAVRQLAELEQPFTVSGELESVDLPRRRSKTTGFAQLKLRIEWSESVPEEVREELDLEPETLRMDLSLQRRPREKPAP